MDHSIISFVRRERIAENPSSKIFEEVSIEYAC